MTTFRFIAGSNGSFQGKIENDESKALMQEHLKLFDEKQMKMMQYLKELEEQRIMEHNQAQMYLRTRRSLMDMQ